MGEIISDPTIRTTQGNQQVTNFLLQFENKQDKDVPVSIKVACWNQLAKEVAESYLKRDRVVVDGRLEANTIDNKVEGIKEKRVTLIATKIVFLNRPTTDVYDYDDVGF